MAPGFAGLDLAAEAGTVRLWAVNLTTPQLEQLAATLTRASPDLPGWRSTDLPGGLVPWTHGWHDPGQARSLEWIDATGDRRAELHSGQAVLESADWFDPGTSTIIDGTLVVTHSSPGLIEAAWTLAAPDGTATPIIVRIANGSLADVTVIVGSIERVSRAQWQSIAAARPQVGDGCDSMFC
jgi:hypothetical protein